MVLGHTDAAEIGATQPFKDLGFESLTAVELRNRLATLTGLRLPTTLAFDHPTPAALAQHLVSRLTAEVAPAGPTPLTGAASPDEPIAIVGMACRFPGADTPEELWRLLADGTDAMGAFPTDRGWNLDSLYSPDPDRGGTTYTRSGGFLTGADRFDADFFQISPREALATDPQQRLLLEIAWEALERAGIDPSSVRGSDTGVFTGVVAQEYAPATLAPPADLAGYLLTGNTTSVASGPHRVRAGAARAGDHHRHGLLVVAGRRAPGDPGAARRGVRPGPGRWGDHHGHPEDLRGVRPAAGPGRGRAVQVVRRRRRRHRLG